MHENDTAAPIAIGTTVKVNCFHASVTRVITALDYFDPFAGKAAPLRLGNPLYEVELDFSRKYSWNEKHVHIPPNCKRMKLFADEFELLDAWEPRELKNQPAYLDWRTKSDV